MRRFTLSDPAFLGGLTAAIPAPIDPSDVDTQAWWKADYYITENTVIGDRMDTTVNKTSTSAPNFNLSRYGSGYASTGRGANDNRANFIMRSDDLTSAFWGSSNITKDSATTLTFTASGGYLKQTCSFTDEAKSFTFKFLARAITGNTNLQILHEGAVEGDKTPVTLTASLTPYSVTFTGVADTAIVVGIQDDNVGGFGQIEFQQMQVVRSDNDTTYISTSGGLPRTGLRDGIPVFMCGNVDAYGFFGTTASRTNNLPYTVYMSAYVRSFYAGWFASNSNPTIWGAVMAADIAGTGGHPVNNLATYVNVSPFAWQYSTTNVFSLGAWYIITLVFNGASSEMRLNKNTADAASHPAGTPSMNGIQIGGESFAPTRSGFDFHEVILRYTADNTATQNLFIDYMAGQIGLSV